MMRDDPSDTLIDLIRRTPVLPIDVKTAQTEGDLPTIAYPRAVTGWQREATAAVPKLREGDQLETVAALQTPTLARLQPPTSCGPPRSQHQPDPAPAPPGGVLKVWHSGRPDRTGSHSQILFFVGPIS